MDLPTEEKVREAVLESIQDQQATLSKADPVLRYGQLKQQIALLNNELEFLQEEVFKRVKAIAGDENKAVDTPYGTYIIAQKKNWTYSPMVAELEQRAKDRKKTEQATGEATFETEEQLRFNILQ